MSNTPICSVGNTHVSLDVSDSEVFEVRALSFDVANSLNWDVSFTGSGAEIESEPDASIW
jgi:hypothetical protein